MGTGHQCSQEAKRSEHAFSELAGGQSYQVLRVHYLLCYSESGWPVSKMMLTHSMGYHWFCLTPGNWISQAPRYLFGHCLSSRAVVSQSCCSRTSSLALVFVIFPSVTPHCTASWLCEMNYSDTMPREASF